MKYIDDKFTTIPSQDMLDQYMQDMKAEIETKEDEKAKEAAIANSSSGFFNQDNIKNLLMKHNNSINQIEKTLKKMI